MRVEQMAGYAVVRALRWRTYGGAEPCGVDQNALPGRTGQIERFFGTGELVLERIWWRVWRRRSRKGSRRSKLVGLATGNLDKILVAKSIVI